MPLVYCWADLCSVWHACRSQHPSGSGWAGGVAAGGWPAQGARLRAAHADQRLLQQVHAGLQTHRSVALEAQAHSNSKPHHDDVQQCQHGVLLSCMQLAVCGWPPIMLGQMRYEAVHRSGSIMLVHQPKTALLPALLAAVPVTACLQKLCWTSRRPATRSWASC